MMSVTKIGCRVSAFRYLDKPYDYAFKIIGELGFDAVETEMLDGHCAYEIYQLCPLISLYDDPVDIRRVASNYGLQISCLSAHTLMLNVDRSKRRLKKAIAFAEKLGARIVDTSVGFRSPEFAYEDMLRIVKHGLDDVLDVAEKHGVCLTLETHGKDTTSVEGLKRVLSLSNSDSFGINFDAANVYVAGHNPVDVLKQVADRVLYVHVKDITGISTNNQGNVTGRPVRVPIGDGDVDIRGCIGALKSKGYGGVYTIETAERDLKQSLSYLRTMI